MELCLSLCESSVLLLLLLLLLLLHDPCLRLRCSVDDVTGDATMTSFSTNTGSESIFSGQSGEPVLSRDFGAAGLCTPAQTSGRRSCGAVLTSLHFDDGVILTLTSLCAGELCSLIGGSCDEDDVTMESGCVATELLGNDGVTALMTSTSSLLSVCT